MTLLALGLNHHTAPVDVRERVSIGEARLEEALVTLRNLEGVNEAAIVSTCNRTEIYCGLETISSRQAEATAAIPFAPAAPGHSKGDLEGDRGDERAPPGEQWVNQYSGLRTGGNGSAAPARVPHADTGTALPERETNSLSSAEPVIRWMHEFLTLGQFSVTPYLFRHADRDAVHHLMRVCSGLDSMILGEPQILGQIKQAYRDAVSFGTLGNELSPLFESAFSVAKQVRTDTAIGSSPVSVAFAAVSLARQIFGDFGKRSALLIGAGDTITLAARHLTSNGIGKIMIANRTVSRAQTLATEVHGTALSLAQITDALPQADIIISSTGSPLPILGKGAVEKALRARRYRPMLIVDIAVPRDVEPQVSELDSVFLYAVDDLQEVIEENRQSRRAAADEAEEIVRNQVEAFMRQLRSQGANHTIRAYRASAETIQEAALAKARIQLARGQDPDSVIKQLAHGLTRKLMHAPTTGMRDAAARGDNALIDAATTLFDLGKPPVS